MTSRVAHHFDDAEQQYEAAGLGMWLFLATEVLFFGGLFAGYALYRASYSHAFAEGSKHLDLILGTINTGILLASSFTMAMSVRAAQTSAARQLSRFLLLTITLGTVFLAIKGYEYYHKFKEHKVPGESFVWEENSELHSSVSDATDKEMPSSPVQPGHVELFYSFYFSMTGLHALHMIIGIGVLGALLVGAWLQRFSADYFTPIEMTGLYWHFVDIVWVFLFPLLYLIR